jgi:hypothetical protein
VIPIIIIINVIIKSHFRKKYFVKYCYYVIIINLDTLAFIRASNYCYLINYYFNYFCNYQLYTNSDFLNTFTYFHFYFQCYSHCHCVYFPISIIDFSLLNNHSLYLNFHFNLLYFAHFFSPYFHVYLYYY